MKKLNRRTLVEKILGLSASISLLGLNSCSSTSNSDESSSSSDEDSSSQILSSSLSGDNKKWSSSSFVDAGCTQTTNDILGPFYRIDIPFDNVPAQNPDFQLSGVVTTDDCVTPIPDAIVEIWHANRDGEYSLEVDDRDHRAIMYTDGEGRYVCNTIFPGKYLNGEYYRPAHFHFKISATDHVTLVTQVYFEGDKDISVDPWASTDEAKKRILKINEGEKVASSTFNIHLKRV